MSKPTEKPRRWPYKNSVSFQGKRVHVLQGAMYGMVVAMMARAGWERALKVEDADLVVFTGGTDVNPALYDQEPKHTSYFDKERDIFEEAVYRKCVKLGIPMFGICRGMQFLHVMNGGELWQDVNNHGGVSHDIYDVDEGYLVKSTSLHHQMVKFNEKMDLLAVTNERVASTYKDENLFVDLTREEPNSDNYVIEVEACSYPETKCFLVQGHPECGEPEYVSWVLYKLNDFLAECGSSGDESITISSATPTRTRSLVETVKQMIG